MNYDATYSENLPAKLDGMLEWVSAGLAAVEEERRLDILKDMRGNFLEKLFEVALENEDYEVCASLVKLREERQLNFN